MVLPVSSYRMTTFEDFHVGEIFPDFESLAEAVDNYSKANFCLFVKGDSKKSKTRGTYDYVSFVCKHGGKMRPSRSEGLRPNQSTVKCGCPVIIRASAISSSETLVSYKIARSILEHNHETSFEIWRSYPENRRANVTNPFGELLSCPSVPDTHLGLHNEKTPNKTLLTSTIKNLKLEVSCDKSSDLKKVKMPKAIILEISESLIAAIKKREVIFNTKSPLYNDRNETEIAWKEVADEVQQEVNFCKTTWSRLTGTYERNLNRLRLLPSDSRASMRQPKWPLFLQMDFLRSHVAHVQMVDNISTNSPNEPMSFTSSTSSTPPASTPNTPIPPPTNLAQSSDDVRHPILKRRRQDQGNNKVEDAFMTLIENSTAESDSSDHVKNFMASLAPFVRQLPPYRQYEFMATTTSNLMSLLNSSEDLERE